MTPPEPQKISWASALSVSSKSRLWTGIIGMLTFGIGALLSLFCLGSGLATVSNVVLIAAVVVWTWGFSESPKMLASLLALGASVILVWEFMTVLVPRAADRMEEASAIYGTLTQKVGKTNRTSTLDEGTSLSELELAALVACAKDAVVPGDELVKSAINIVTPIELAPIVGATEVKLMLEAQPKSGCCQRKSNCQLAKEAIEAVSPGYFD